MTGNIRILSLGLSLALAGLPTGLGAQSAGTAEARLEQAAHHELVLGDLQRAIGLYRDVIAAYPGDRSAVARALVGLGRANERLGSREARAAYERVVRDYGDQVEPARVARGRLQAIAANGPDPARAGAHTLVLSELPIFRPRDDPQFDLSPDGDRIVYREDVYSDSLNGVTLIVTNSGGTVKRTLVPPRNRMGIASPRWSPDGQYIAFFRRAFLEVDSAYHALVVIPAGGGSERILTDSLEIRIGGATGGMAWTPDSRAVTVATPRGVVTVALDGKILRDVPLRLGYLEQITGYSPDGRWLAMHRRPEGSQQDDEQDVWLLPAAGGRAIQVTHEPGFEGWPHWASDGRTLFFISDRSGSQNVWTVEVDPQSGLPRGAARQVTTYTDALILHPRPVGNGRALSFTLFRETTAIHVGPADSPGQGRVIARGERPMIAPDGRTVYFLGQGSELPGIFSVSAEGGTPRRLTESRPGGPFFNAFSVSPSGDAIAYFNPLGGQRVLLTVPSAGGQPQELARFESRENLTPSWSPDGKQLAYSHGNGLYAVPAAGGESTKLAHLYGWDGWTLQWSPDGGQIAALAWSAPNQQNAVFVVPARGGEARRLTAADEVGYKEGLQWHPDGTRLSYMDYGIRSRRDGSRLAYLDGRPTSTLVDLPPGQWDYVGVWHPAGRDFYFISSRTRAWDLFAYNEPTGASRVVVSRGSAVPGLSPPSFSADGRVMTWSVANTTRQLWTIELPK